MDIKKKIEQKETTTIMLNYRDIIEYLESKDITVAVGAEISVHVPSGVDWSNTDLDIDDDTQIKVEFTEETDISNL